MRTNYHPIDYQPRRFNMRDSEKELAGFFDAKADRPPRLFGEYPEKLRLDWYAVRDAWMCLKAYKGISRTEKRRLNDDIKLQTARFNTTFNMWWAGELTEECTCTAISDACPSCVEMLDKQEIPY